MKAAITKSIYGDVLDDLFKALLQQGAVESPRGRVHGVAKNELSNAELEIAELKTVLNNRIFYSSELRQRLYRLFTPVEIRCI